MLEQITRLESPIDVMYLMHKAFEAQSQRTEALAAQAQQGGSLGEFNAAFKFWITQLLYHAETEDKYMTGPLTDSQPARDNETEHDELRQQGGEIIEFLAQGDSAGLADNVKAAMVALEEEQHRELVEAAQEVEDVLKKAIGEDRVVARTRRHLYRRVMALRVLEFDHFENEEAFVLPLVKEQMAGPQELEVARRLLIDDDATEPRWIIDWVASEMKPHELRLLRELETQFSSPAT
ncbi:MAG: hemerythrin domain-containing protein [Chloroflexi bacterium]|nr:hemerythrin domain-containing protein [Chloroflexota bacterium]